MGEKRVAVVKLIPCLNVVFVEYCDDAIARESGATWVAPSGEKYNGLEFG
jgi:hypothetical protein